MLMHVALKIDVFKILFNFGGDCLSLEYVASTTTTTTTSTTIIIINICTTSQ